MKLPAQAATFIEYVNGLTKRNRDSLTEVSRLFPPNNLILTGIELSQEAQRLGVPLEELQRIVKSGAEKLF